MENEDKALYLKPGALEALKARDAELKAEAAHLLRDVKPDDDRDTVFRKMFKNVAEELGKMP